jgi:hypothetical protein
MAEIQGKDRAVYGEGIDGSQVGHEILRDSLVIAHMGQRLEQTRLSLIPVMYVSRQKSRLEAASRQQKCCLGLASTF